MFANYSKLEYNLLKAASKIIEAERQRSQHITDIITKYIDENKDVYISRINEAVIYTEHLSEHSKKITLLIQKATDLQVHLFDSIPNFENSIWYNGRFILFIRSISPYPKIDLTKLINPDGNYFPPELELIEVYRKLYSPQEFELWDEYASVEKEQYEKLISKFNITGGTCASKFIKEVDTLRQLTLHEFINEHANVVLIGSWAIQTIKAGISNEQLQSNDRLQIITDLSAETLFNQFIGFAKTDISSRNLSFDMREQSLHIPNDIRLKRYSIYVTSTCDETQETIFMDVFCNALYELVPFVLSNRIKRKKIAQFPKNIQIGNLYVLIRFFLIDMWIIRIIHLLGAIPEHHMKSMVNKLLGMIKYVHSNYLFAHKTLNLSYIGVYHPDEFHKKKLIELNR